MQFDLVSSDPLRLRTGCLVVGVQASKKLSPTAQAVDAALLSTVEVWLRKEAGIKKQELAARGIVKKKVFEYQRNSGWGEGRMASTVSFGPELGMKHTGIKGSSNAVMRN